MDTNTKRRESCPALPAGWTMESIKRLGGVSSGKWDVYYYSPAGKKIRSKPELIREIGDVYDLSSFDYSAGKMGTSLIKPGRCRKQVKKAGKEDNEGSDLSVLVPPIRQTASIFKQPVTLYRTHQAEVKKNIRTDKEKPRQLFWEKRLSDVSPNHSDEETLFKSLPACIKELDWLGGRSNSSTLLASISTALHTTNKPIIGQTVSPGDEDKNICLLINPEQPIVSSLSISDQEIKEQEERVHQARSRLAQAVKALS